MVEANPVAVKPKKVQKSGALRVSTAECVNEKLLLREIIQANGYVEIENRNHQADVVFLHPMAEGASKFPFVLIDSWYFLDISRVLTSKGIFNKLPGVKAAKNKRKCAQVFERMYQLYGD